MPSPLKHGEPCVLMKRESCPDGMGGRKSRWSDGKGFTALITLDRSAETQKAEQDAVKDTYITMVPKKLDIAAGEYFRRESDGAILRVASSPDEQETPARSRMDYKVFSAVKSALPDAERTGDDDAGNS